MYLYVIHNHFKFILIQKQMFFIPVRSTDDCSFLIPFLSVLSCLEADEIITTTYKLNNWNFTFLYNN